jgi:hypothetical protein
MKGTTPARMPTSIIDLQDDGQHVDTFIGEILNLPWHTFNWSYAYNLVLLGVLNYKTGPLFIEPYYPSH